MNIKKIFTLFLLIASFSLLASAQDKNKDKDLAQQQRMEDLRRQQEQLNQNFGNTTPFVFDNLDYFLPNSKDAWFISITTHGGILGGTRLLAAVNSDGNYLCSTQQDFTNQLAEKDAFISLFRTISEFDFKELNAGESKKIEGCKDCAYTTLTFQNADETYRYSRNTFANAESGIKAIYDTVIASAACQK